MTTGAQILAQMHDTQARRLVNDSRQVHSGDAFIAYPGEHVDGRDFIQQAIAQGATAVLWESSGYAWNADWKIANWPVNDLREQVGSIASAFYGEPSQKLWVIGVTGTNGKTSCSHWLAQALQILGRKTAVIGTLGNGFPNALSATINTTPDPILLHGLLADYLAQGATDIAMEVSSHALVQHRVNGMRFDVAVLTNLSRDHLDFHGNMSNYIAAKRMLFDWPDLQHAVLNIDDPFGAEMSQQLGKRDVNIVTYGFNHADVQGHELSFNARGLSMRVTTPQGETMLSAELVGRFNAYNLLAVLAALLCSGIDLQEAVGAISKLAPVAGRMQQLGGGKLPLVVVDYAHTPDALEKVLSTLKEQCTGRLICVFGCGGDRDKGKRPLMGETVSKLADYAIVTADNPRHEKVEDIITDIVQGMIGEYLIEPDRASAIRTAIQQAQAGDIVLLAGKGHEGYQQIGEVQLPFSDLAIAREALSSMTLSTAAKATNGQLIGADATFNAVSTDSRKITTGNLFIALKGESFDGHDYAKQCLQQDAAGILVSRRIETDSPQIVVQDTRLALGKLAQYWREQFNIPLAAITGSNGKTTVKEMLAAILRHVAGDEHVLATEGNLNNDIGLPLTLLKLQAHHRFAVAEMGMSNPGEIDYLAQLAHPSVALVNNAHPAHLQGMGNVEAIAREKGSIFNGLGSSDTAVFNADDTFAPLWKSLAGSKKTLTFGLNQPADISADYELKPDSSNLTIKTAGGNIPTTLNVPGIHNISNALAATAAALAMGVSLSDIATGLGNFAGVKGRLQRKQGKGGVLVIDDSYNANPASMRAAIAVLASTSGRKVLVLGDMGELGNDARRLHEEIGEFAKQSGIDQLFALGELSQHTVLAFGTNARHFDTPVALTEALAPYLQSDTTILVKGSRFMKMERVTEAILKDTNACQQAERVH